LVNIIYYQI